MKTIKTNCEFASELICVIPYAILVTSKQSIRKGDY